MKAIGIDLGTTSSLVAVVEDGRPRVLEDAAGDAVLPSAVAYAEDGAVFVGRVALQRAEERPHDTIFSVKRLLGRSVAEVTAHGLRPYRLADERHGDGPGGAAGGASPPGAGDENVLRLWAGGRTHTPVEVAAEILRALRERAAAHLGRDVRHAVITVPANADHAQRQATRQAGRLAGLEVLRLLSEPAAAALAYGLDRRREGRFAVFDLGGGTFDVSILHLVDGTFEVLAVAGDPQLGGDDLDRAVARALLLDAGVDPATVEPAVRRRAVLAAGRAKEALTRRFDVRVDVPLPGGRTHRRRLSRGYVEQILLPVLDRTIAPCRRALADAGLRPTELDGVVLVGGSTRSPLVQRFVATLFEQKPLTGLDPDHVVALGAAIQADLLSAASELRRQGDDVLVLEAAPSSLGLETPDGGVDVLIPRCSTLPASHTRTVATWADDQRSLELHVVQGESELAAECRSLARLHLEGLSPRPAGRARVDVTFLLDADGLLTVTARDEEGREQRLAVESRPDRRAPSAAARASGDRRRAEAVVSAERRLAEVEHLLRARGDRLTSGERAALTEAITDLRMALQGGDPDEIGELTAVLEQVGGRYAPGSPPARDPEPRAAGRSADRSADRSAEDRGR